MTIIQVSTAEKETAGYISLLGETSRTHLMDYCGKHKQYHGMLFIAQVVAEVNSGIEVYVFPLLSSSSVRDIPGIEEVPHEIRDELSDIVRARFGFDKTPKYLRA